MKKKIVFIGIAVIAMVAGGAYWLSAAPTIGGVAANPAYVVINTPTEVLFTVTIPDSSVVPSGVNLLEVDATGRTLRVVGAMRDDGTNGDAIVGDHVFSLRTPLNIGGVANTHYRMSVATRGTLRRTLSQPITVETWSTIGTALDLSLAIPPGATVSENTSDRLVIRAPGGSGFRVDVLRRQKLGSELLQDWILRRWYLNTSAETLAASLRSHDTITLYAIDGHPAIILTKRSLGTQLTAFIEGDSENVIVVKMLGESLAQSEAIELKGHVFRNILDSLSM